MQEFDSLMEMYEQGLITRGELVNKLMALAATIHPSDYIPRLPPDLRQAIKDNHYVKSPPVSPEEPFSVETVCYKPGIDQVAAADQRLQQRFNALRALNKYFVETKSETHSGQSSPSDASDRERT